MHKSNLSSSLVDCKSSSNLQLIKILKATRAASERGSSGWWVKDILSKLRDECDVMFEKIEKHYIEADTVNMLYLADSGSCTRPEVKRRRRKRH